MAQDFVMTLKNAMLLRAVLHARRPSSLKETSSIETELLRLKMEQPMNGPKVVNKSTPTLSVPSPVSNHLWHALRLQSVQQNESEGRKQ
jgi:hypothetical protein